MLIMVTKTPRGDQRGHPQHAQAINPLQYNIFNLDFLFIRDKTMKQKLKSPCTQRGTADIGCIKPLYYCYIDLVVFTSTKKMNNRVKSIVIQRKKTAYIVETLYSGTTCI
jgi:hypothetical protein